MRWPEPPVRTRRCGRTPSHGVHTAWRSSWKVTIALVCLRSALVTTSVHDYTQPPRCDGCARAGTARTATRAGPRRRRRSISSAAGRSRPRGRGRQVDVRPVEEPHRLQGGIRLPARARRLKQVRLDDQPPAEQHGRRWVEPAGVGNRPEHQAGRDRQVGVARISSRHPARRSHHGQHRHVGGGVVLAVTEGQRPGVRRRPEEHDEEQHHRRPGQRSRHRRPADERREAACRPAPDDVVRRTPLEQHVV